MHRYRPHFLLPATLLLAALLAAGGCGKNKPASVQQAGKVRVVATFYPLYEFARLVGGDRVEVQNLVPAGAEPHDWEPSPKDVTSIKQADLFIYNGAGFEPWIERLMADGTMSEVRERARPRPVRATRGLTLYNFVPSKETGALVRVPAQSAGAAQDGVSGSQGGPLPDPHVWLDPVLAQRQVATIAGALSEIDPAGRSDYNVRAAVYMNQLAALDQAFREGLRDCDRRDVIASHSAFGYLAWRYGLNLIPMAGVRPEGEPTPADVTRIAALAKEKGVRYVFTETLLDAKTAETVAREAGAKTLVLNPLEGLTKEDLKAGRDYFSVMRDNLQNLRTALGCR